MVLQGSGPSCSLTLLSHSIWMPTSIKYILSNENFCLPFSCKPLCTLQAEVHVGTDTGNHFSSLWKSATSTLLRAWRALQPIVTLAPSLHTKYADNGTSLLMYDEGWYCTESHSTRADFCSLHMCWRHNSVSTWRCYNGCHLRCSS